MTRVRRALWAVWASCTQSGPAPPGLAWPVTNTTPWAWSRWVSGAPRLVSAARPEVMPLTMLGSMPCSRRYCTSSPPRPKMKGSPPLRRTTRSPCCTSCSIKRRMNACGVLWQPPRLPTCTTRAAGAAQSSTASSTKSSTSSTVAWRMALTAAMVNKSGLPGPAPTKVQLPWPGCAGSVGCAGASGKARARSTGWVMAGCS